MFDLPPEIPDFNPQVQVTQMQRAGHFNFYYNQDSKNHVAGELFPVDLNNDGIQEIIMAGFETNTAESYNGFEPYSKTKVMVWGFRGGKLTNISNQWLDGAKKWVEGVGDVKFGDFNGDGLIDAYLSANTDRTESDTYDEQGNKIPVYAYQLINVNGHHFEKIRLPESQWEHGAAVADINDDGYDDVIVSAYEGRSITLLGSENGLVRYDLPPFSLSGSSVAVGDFMGDGTKTMIFSDANNDTDDTIIAEMVFNWKGEPVGTRQLGVLPRPILENEYWRNEVGLTGSHDIRVIPFDFNHDGLMDVLVLSRAWVTSDWQWPKVSAVQFLENQGDGYFEDVTDERLVGYNHRSGIAYEPVITDINKDGRLDIFMSSGSWGERHDSTRVLFQQEDGTFIEGLTEKFNKLYEGDKSSMVGNLVRGIGGHHYFVTRNHSQVTGFDHVYYTRLISKPVPIPRPTAIGGYTPTITEGDTTKKVFITARLHNPKDHDILVNGKTIEGTAKAEKDFVPKGFYRKLKPGWNNVVVGVEIIGDTEPEEYEKTFTVRYMVPNSKHRTHRIAVNITKTILDDD